MEYGHFLKSVLDSYDTEETFMKWVEPVTKPKHSLASVANDDTLNKSFDNTLIDTIFDEQTDKISDGKTSGGFDELHNNNSVTLVIETNQSQTIIQILCKSVLNCERDVMYKIVILIYISKI